MSGSGRLSTAVWEVLETVPVGVVVLTDEGDITGANARAEELLGLTKSDIEGRRYDGSEWDIWGADGEPIQPVDHPVTEVIATGEAVQGFTHGITLPDGSERWLSSNAAPVRDEDGAIEHVVVALEDVTGPKQMEKLIETFQPVLALLNRVTTRTEAEQGICDRLTDSRAYELAWVTEYTPGGAVGKPDVERGPDGAVPLGLVSPLGVPEADVGPEQVAVETGEIQAVTGSDPAGSFERWWGATLEHGYRGSAVIPLAYGDRTYGLLGLSAARADAFGPRERTLLGTVADRFGRLLHALKTEHRLHADTVAELTFQSTDPGSVFVHASATLGCTVDILDTIPTVEETLLHYASVSGAPLAEFVTLVEADFGGTARVIRQAAAHGGDVEVELRWQSLAHALVDTGAVVTSDTITEGNAEVVCEVPADEDIEALVDQLTASFPETTLAAKQEYDRNVASARARPVRVLADTFRDELTDRQRQVLTAAVYAGYFESPRRTTATEIADALSLTQSTVSYHLRNAQQTLFERLLERSS